MKKEIGKNTLGGGNKMQVDLRTYNRSTHNLSHAWRNTQGVGTLVPCYKELALPGDTFDITIDAKVLTHPTVGPLFGSYKLQVDFFTCPIRLYNAMLHNNALNVGMDMSKVKLPQFQITAPASMFPPNANDPWSQIHPSCVLSYLGYRGWGIASTSEIKYKNAVPALAYLDIFKNYYANKQEEDYYWIGTNKPNSKVDNLTYAWVYEGNTGVYNRQVSSGNLYIGGVSSQDDLRQVTYLWETQRQDANLKITSGSRELTYDQMLQYFTVTVNTQTKAATFTYKEDLDAYSELNASAFITTLMNGQILQIQSAPLEELDELREKILGAGTSIVYISNESKTNITYFNKLLGYDTSQNFLATKSANAGLLLKTHQSDLFNNWINTEWIDGENGISAITAIDTSSGEFTIDTLNLAKKVYDMLNRIAVSGGTYRDWIETVYTSDYTIHAETPIYEGGMSDEIVFEQVVSNSATTDEPLGTLAGRGTLGGQRKGGKLHIKVTEPSYIIGICSITPRVDYCQGNDWDVYLETMNDLHKPQLDGIGYQDLETKLAAWWKDNKSDTQKAIGKQPAWINYMTSYNKTYGNFAIENNEAFMCLNRWFDPETTEDDKSFINKPINFTSYINPTDFNYQFAETSLEAQNFWVQLGFGVEARRVMSAKQIPNL